MPLHMRLPKLKGFKNPFRTEYQVVNLDKLAELFPEGGEVGADELVAKGRGRDKGQLVKVLGTGDLRSALKVTAHALLRPRPGEDHRCRRVRHRAAAAAGRAGARVGRPAPGRAPGRRGYSRRASDGETSVACPTPGHAAPDSPSGAGPPGGAVLTAFGRAFRTPDLRKKLLFTLAMIALYRLGSVVPGPGVDLPVRHPDLPVAGQGQLLLTAWSTCSAAARCCS